jgi:hypothetical protein
MHLYSIQKVAILTQVTALLVYSQATGAPSDAHFQSSLSFSLIQTISLFKQYANSSHSPPCVPLCNYGSTLRSPASLRKVRNTNPLRPPSQPQSSCRNSLTSSNSRASEPLGARVLLLSPNLRMPEQLVTRSARATPSSQATPKIPIWLITSGLPICTRVRSSLCLSVLE